MHSSDPGSRVAAADQFVPDGIPIAERDGAMLICDARPGTHQGCMSEFGEDTADAYPPTWASPSALLAELTESLTNTTPFNKHAPS
ncbi:hypothetical protein IU487_33790 [Nocardia puris]|nr:hypothetical protein [Nocardia puris]MBF6215973.1 hypothetical protein [Nocardia puris]